MLIGDLPNEETLPELDLAELTLPPELPLSMPSELIRRRPDIRAAEALLHQACAQVGVATANMLPQFNLFGDWGYEGISLSRLIAPANEIFDIGIGMVQPVFQGGFLAFKRRAAKAAYQQAKSQYREVVLQAFQNVADALRAIEKDAEFLKAQTEAEKAAHDLMDMTEKQFKLGAVNYLLLLNAEREYQTTVLNRIQAEGLRYTDTVALFQALGGGWWDCDAENG
jgi:NodT family efflux transporter outer membrane factor (OMF) lipoprotein